MIGHRNPKELGEENKKEQWSLGEDFVSQKWEQLLASHLGSE